MSAANRRLNFCLIPKSSIVVVGSSPLLLLISLYLSRLGHKVTIIEKSSNLGGCWKLVNGDNFLVEDACHLLESYSKSYDFLIKKIGICMVDFSASKYPVRVYRGNKTTVVRYHSRKSIILDSKRELISFTKVFIKLAICIIKADSNKIPYTIQNLNLSLQNIQNIVLNKLPQLFTFQPLMIHPRGWGGFIFDLIKLCETEKNIQILHARFNHIDMKHDGCIIKTDLGESLKFNYAITGQSLILNSGNDRNKLTPEPNPDSINSKPNKSAGISYSYLFAFENSLYELFSKLPQYIHFYGDPVFHRLTTVENLRINSENSFFLLLQTRKKFFLDQVEIAASNLILNLLNDLSLGQHLCELKSNPFLKCIEEIKTNAALSGSKQDHFCEGWHQSLLVVRSIGDLSKHIAYNDKYFNWL